MKKVQLKRWKVLSISMEILPWILFRSWYGCIPNTLDEDKYVLDILKVCSEIKTPENIKVAHVHKREEDQTLRIILEHPDFPEVPMGHYLDTLTVSFRNIQVPISKQEFDRISLLIEKEENAGN